MDNLVNENSNSQSENINEKSEANGNYISSKVSVDFFVQQVKIYITVPTCVINKFLQSSNNDYIKQIKLTHNIELSKNKHLIINKKFTVSEDLKNVVIDSITHQIPNFFNKESIKNEDTKTWEMIFYQIFSDEVSKSILNFKELYKQNKNNDNIDNYVSQNVEQDFNG